MASRIRRRDASNVGLSNGLIIASQSVVVALTPWLFESGSDQSTFLVFWAVIFGLSGVLTGVSLEVTRTASRATRGGADLDSMTIPQFGPSLIRLGATLGLAAAALLAATAPFWGWRFFPTYSLPLAMLVAFGVFANATENAQAGVLAGVNRWSLYAQQMTVIGAVRIVAIPLAAILTQSVVVTALVTVLSFLTWLLVPALVPSARLTLGVKSDSPLPKTLSRVGASAGAMGLAAVLGVGFPALLSLGSSATELEMAAPLLLALTLTRAPLMIPLAAFQAMLVSHLAQWGAGARQALLRLSGYVIGIGALGSFAAWLAGPLVLAAIWGADFAVAGWVLACLVMGATGLALLTLTSAYCQASGQHRAFIAGWAAAVLTATITIWLPTTLELRAIIALFGGTAAGLVLQIAAIYRESSPISGARRAT